jgi:hypothetical protein
MSFFQLSGTARIKESPVATQAMSMSGMATTSRLLTPCKNFHIASPLL